MGPKTAAKSTSTTWVAVTLIMAASLLGGRYAGSLPAEKGWRYPFSFHPFCMVLGVGLAVSGALVKKLG